MKIDYRQPEETADVSASRESDIPEFLKLSALALVSIFTLYILIGWLVDLAVMGIDYDREMRFFNNLADSTQLLDSEPVPDTLQQTFDKLTTQEIVPNVDYRLVVLEESAPNAFAFPGGTIAVTSGLLEALDGEMELAFVLAHELGHFYNRDHLRGMGRAIGLSVIYSLFFSNTLDSSAVASLPLLVMNASYSRRQESAADFFALDLIQATFGTTENYDRLFRELEERASQPGWTEMFSTHPLPRNRIERLNEYVLELNGGR